VLAFVADDDVWLAPVSGGRAWRFSADRTPASRPRFSRDGAELAWTSWRHGQPEILLADTGSGQCRRVTYWGDRGTRTAGWTPDGDLLAVSGTGAAFERFTSAYVIPRAGGAPRRQPFGPVADLAADAAAVVLLNGTWGRDPAYWKRYRGGTAGRLWSGTPGLTAPGGRSGPAGRGSSAGEPRFTRVLAGLGGQFASPMLAGGRLVFLSDHEGTGNVYSCQLDGSDLLRHTDHDGFYARNASTDGRRVVYQCAGELWVLDDLTAGSQPRPLAVTLGSPATGLAPRLVSAAAELGDLSCDETGRASAVEVSGTVHWLTHRDGPARALAVGPGARARLPRVLGRSQVAWVTDAAGPDAVEIAPADGAGERRRLGSGELGRVSSMAAAPDGSVLAVAARDGRLHLLAAATGRVTLLARSEDGPVTGLAFSPDSAWLAWAQPCPGPLSQIRLARLAGPVPSWGDDPPGTPRPVPSGGDGPPGTPRPAPAPEDGPPGPSGPEVINVTDGRFTDYEPVFTRDGKHLAFLSRRSFDPVYDAHSFDMGFPNGCRPFLVPLAAASPSPFGPLPEGRAVGEEPGEEDGKDGVGGARPAGPPAAGGAPAPAGDREPTAAAEEKGGSNPAAVVVDAAAISERVVPLPVPESLYSSLHPVSGGLAWLREAVTGVLGESQADPDDDAPRPVLERFDLAKRECTELASGADWFAASGDGKLLVIRDQDELRVVPSGRKDDSDGTAVKVDLSRARFLADPAAQRRHAFGEAGRFMRHDFWVPDMADVDWDAVLDTYRPLLDRLATADDFADLLFEVFGEIGSSHAYVSPASRDDSDAPQVGHLGADLAQAPDGSWRVARVLPGESSDPRARSPLAAPGAGIEPGATLLAVDGQPVDPATGPGPLLVGAGGKPVELTVAADGREPRRVVVTPLTSDRRLRYQDWVAANRRRVRELSGGRAGYLHVPDMMGEGWAHFHRDLRTEMTRDTLIVDVRQNRGGHVSELVVEKLARRIMGWDMGRNMRPLTYPRDAPRGPVVALTDEFAGSDGDMVTAAIRILGLGPVVGARTWGGVIGIDGFYQLVDGTGVTVPRYAIWLQGYGWGVENHGVDPDVEVIISPAEAASGQDPQLATAVRLALEALETRPAATPPDRSTRPSRRPGQLPPRSGPR
jgi:tricorn protease